MNGIELKIHELLAQAVVYLNSGDLNDLMKMWDNSAILMMPETPALYGNQSISKWLGNHMKIFSYKLELDIGDIKPDGSLACVSGQFLIHIRNLLNKNLCIHNGKFLIVMYRIKHHWHIYSCCCNSSLPPVNTK